MNFSRPALAGVALAALLVAASRLPLATTVPQFNDSFNFCLALRDGFEPRAEAPHAPGYPLYVLAGKALYLLLPPGAAGDPANRALVLLSILCSALAVALLWRLGRLLAGPGTAGAAVLLLAAAPAFWLYGEVALSYAPGLCVSLLIADCCWRGLLRDPRWLAAGAAALALGAGVRPPDALALAPLWLACALLAWRRGQAGGRFLAACCLLGLGLFLAWFAPLAAAYGGLGELRRAFAGTGAAAVAGLSFAWGDLGRAFLFALGLALPPAALGLAAALRRAGRGEGQARLKLALGAAWVLPTLLQMLLVTAAQFGYLFPALGAWLLLGARGLRAALPAGRGFWLAAGLLAAGNAAFFLFLPPGGHWPDDGPRAGRLGRLGAVSGRRGLARREAEILGMAGELRARRAEFPPATTRLLHSRRKREIRYFLPEYDDFRQLWRLAGGDRELPAAVAGLRVVVYEPECLGRLAAPLAAAAMDNYQKLPGGAPFCWFAVPAGARLAWRAGRLEPLAGWAGGGP